MAIDKFIKALMSYGVIDEQDIYEALNIQMSQKKPIGQIALIEKLLTVKEVFAVLNEQIDSKRLFGEIAIDLGFLSKNDLAYLLQVQKDGVPSLCSILVEMERIDEAVCSRIYEAFKNTQ